MQILKHNTGSFCYYSNGQCITQSAWKCWQHKWFNLGKLGDQKYDDNYTRVRKCVRNCFRYRLIIGYCWIIAVSFEVFARFQFEKLHGSPRFVFFFLLFNVWQRSAKNLKKVIGHAIWNIFDQIYLSPKYHSYWFIIMYLIPKKKSQISRPNNFQMKGNVEDKPYFL